VLTEKEAQVLKLRKEGLTQTEIAKRLKISQPAVSSFERSIAKKVKESVELLEFLKGIGMKPEGLPRK